MTENLHGNAFGVSFVATGSLEAKSLQGGENQPFSLSFSNDFSTICADVPFNMPCDFEWCPQKVSNFYFLLSGPFL